jgi:glycogen debranching enzyme
MSSASEKLTQTLSPDREPLMAETVRLDEQFYIVAEAERSTTPLRVLKQGDSFAVFDTHGDITPETSTEQGLYHSGTRFLSRLELLLGRRRPLLLNSMISEDNVVFTGNLTNPDILRDGHIIVSRGEIHILRSRVLWNGGYGERIRISNHSLHPIEVPLTVHFDADYADVFEARGSSRPRRGRRLPDRRGEEYVVGYIGLDGVERRTIIRWSRQPNQIEEGSAKFLVALNRHATADLELSVGCEIDDTPAVTYHFGDAVAQSKRRVGDAEHQECVVSSSNEAFNRWVRRSSADLHMMMTETPYGPYPYAGIPWFSTPFGRDGLITALELLPLAPSVARGVLTFLADTQATTRSDRQDAQPGKILHEMRSGEMAALGEVPFGRYYGSADATPLFVMLAHAYFERTGDADFIDTLWRHVLAALDWITDNANRHRDGFVIYERRSETGLVQQGWKDSYDAVFHTDASLAEPPIAMCEIQGYCYAAWKGAAQLANARGDHKVAARWDAKAERLRANFDRAFWCDEIGTYALALDGDNRPCQVRTSNPGHALFAGIASPERAARVAEALLSDTSFAGWGVRTVSEGEARYNPMSYHNGSIWPHDNAVIASGLARYGFQEAACRILNGMLDLSAAVDLNRLPELICGFHRREAEFPTLYPVACAPQSWAAGAVFMMLTACLGLRIDAAARRITLTRALLPESIEWLRLTNLSIGEASVDLLLSRHPFDVGITVLRRDGDVEIVGVK